MKFLLLNDSISVVGECVDGGLPEFKSKSDNTRRCGGDGDRVGKDSGGNDDGKENDGSDEGGVEDNTDGDGGVKWSVGIIMGLDSIFFFVISSSFSIRSRIIKYSRSPNSIP